MMFAPVTTNLAGILTIMVLWCVLTWMVTYMFMSRRVQDLEAKIEVLDWYCYESDRDVHSLMEEVSLTNSEIVEKDEKIAQLIASMDAESAPVTYRVTDYGRWIRGENDAV